MKEKVNVPNSLTAVRLVLAPIVFLLVLFGQGIGALIVFMVAAATDLLDGWTARRYGHTSEFGAKFDPVADKCLMFAAFLSLAITGMVPWWFFGIVVGRDFLILLAAIIFLGVTSVKKFPPSVWGKVSTFVQVFVAVALIIRALWFSWSLAFNFMAGDIIFASAALTIWSGIDYAVRGFKMRKLVRNVG